ncbi:MAG: ABC transporter substrate-binding protein [Desulfurococcaceae archaeon]
MSKLIILMISIGLILGAWNIEGSVYIDALGREVHIYKLERIVSLAPSITETLMYLGVGDLLIGVDSSSLESWFMGTGNYLRSRNVSVTGGYWWSSVSIEKVIALNPDLVFADVGAHAPLLEAFESHNIPVYYLHGGGANNLEEVLEDIRTLGILFNRSSKAEELIERIHEALNTWGKRVEGDFGRIKAVTIIDLTDGIWVAGKDTFIDDILKRMGIINVATTQGWSLVSLEQIISWNPDVIFVALMYEVSNETIQEIGLYDLSKPIIVFNSTEADMLLRPGPLLIYLPEVIYNALVKANITRDHMEHEFIYQSISLIVIIAISTVSLGIIALRKPKR